MYPHSITNKVQYEANQSGIVVKVDVCITLFHRLLIFGQHFILSLKSKEWPLLISKLVMIACH